MKVKLPKKTAMVSGLSGKWGGKDGAFSTHGNFWLQESDAQKVYEKKLMKMNVPKQSWLELLEVNPKGGMRNHELLNMRSQEYAIG